MKIISLICIVFVLTVTGCETSVKEINKLEQQKDIDKLSSINNKASLEALGRILNELIHSRRINSVTASVKVYRWIESSSISVNTPKGIRTVTNGRWISGGMDVSAAQKIRFGIINFLKDRQLLTDDVNGVTLIVSASDYPAHRDSMVLGGGYASEFGYADGSPGTRPSLSWASDVEEVFFKRWIFVGLSISLNGKEYEFGNSECELVSALRKAAEETF